MALKTATIRIREDLADWLTDNYKGINQGVVESVEALKTIRLYSLNELKEKFTKEEWVFFADSLNGSITDGMFRCNVGALIAHCEDAETYESTATRHGVDLEALIEKCKGLTGAQVEALYWRVEGFWNDENRDTDKFATF